MKFIYLLFLLPIIKIISSDKIIKNNNIPACRNCKYYKTNLFNNDYTSFMSQCEKFSEKNIITDKITNDYADICRKDEEKCGFEGKYFEEENNIILNLKILKHSMVNNLPKNLFILGSIIVMSNIYTLFCD